MSVLQKLNVLDTGRHDFSIYDQFLIEYIHKSCGCFGILFSPSKGDLVFEKITFADPSYRSFV